MANTLIRLAETAESDEGSIFLVEVVANSQVGEQVASGVATQVESTIDYLKPILKKVCQPVIETWKELGREVQLSEAEIELGFSFDFEGNLYVTKGKASANLSVTIKFTPLPK